MKTLENLFVSAKMNPAKFSRIRGAVELLYNRQKKTFTSCHSVRKAFRSIDATKQEYSEGNHGVRSLALNCWNPSNTFIKFSTNFLPAIENALGHAMKLCMESNPLFIFPLSRKDGTKTRSNSEPFFFLPILNEKSQKRETWLCSFPNVNLMFSWRIAI